MQMKWQTYVLNQPVVKLITMQMTIQINVLDIVQVFIIPLGNQPQKDVFNVIII